MPEAAELSMKMSHRAAKAMVPGSGVGTISQALALGVCTALLAGCVRDDPRAAVGDPHAGAVAIARNACGSCHQIPGIEEANGKVGPSLAGFARRQTIAGVLPNTPVELAGYLKNPQAAVSSNVMPSEGLTDRQANDIAAYLYTQD